MPWADCHFSVSLCRHGTLAYGAAGPRIAYSVDIVYKQGLKGLRAG